MTRPNILVIQADQMTALCLSAYGKPYAITPNIDKMAENGTTFANSYCNNPVCGPSRASMMTGRLPSKRPRRAPASVPRPRAGSC